MISTYIEETIKQKYELLKPELNERMCRLWAASEVKVLGYGGISTVSRATGITISTIRAGIRELEDALPGFHGERVRHNGGGRKNITDINPELLVALDALVDPITRGDPESSLRWTCKSTRKLAMELTKQGHSVSHMKVSQLLKEMGYSLQAPSKTLEGMSHPDRNAQFEFINEQVKEFQKREQPVVSVDSKKREIVGNFVNKGREYQPKGEPEKVNGHDFPDKVSGKAIPYGIYDLTNNDGWVSIGTDNETSQFAVETLRRWWKNMGCKRYPKAEEILITADSGGSNGYRRKLWKVELQRFADESGLNFVVSHFPPGTSKWNKIEHRMFSHISQNWRGRPLISHEVIVNLIANTTTKTGLKIKAELDNGQYPTGIKVSKQQMIKLNIDRSDFHGEDWNYIIKPRQEQV
ncbi:MAG: ISAzo13 family transposase [Halobacteriota archaeon]|nr:ISAzo13 family transposase [Halobacteriota archaeon]